MALNWVSRSSSNSFISYILSVKLSINWRAFICSLSIENNIGFLLDPRLSIPYFLPFTEILIICEISYGDDKNAVIFYGGNSLKLNVSSKGKEITFPCQGLCNIDYFYKMALYFSRTS